MTIRRSSIDKNRNARLAGGICLTILCAIVAIMCLFPFLALILSITKTSRQIQSGFAFSVGTNLFENFKSLIEFMNDYDYSIIRSFFNSCIISISSTSLCIYFSALTAYACHVYDFKFKKFFEKFILLLIIIPGQLGAVGFFRLVMNFGLDNTYVPFIFPAIAAPSTVYFLRQYMKSNFSREYVDAGRMDGASEFRIFNTICLPYIKAGIATMALFGIISSWNNFMGPLTFLSDSNLYTLPQIMYYLTAAELTDYGAYYLSIFITMLPMLIVYFFMSKTIMKGVSAGGLK